MRWRYLEVRAAYRVCRLKLHTATQLGNMQNVEQCAHSALNPPRAATWCAKAEIRAMWGLANELPCMVRALSPYSAPARYDDRDGALIKPQGKDG